MNKLLSICIPTFNRAKELNSQLAWLAKEIKGFEDECEVIVSDNCSTDNTPDIINEWQPVFERTTFKSNKNSENLGWMRNFIYCLNASTSQYTWIISDDDLIFEGTLAYVIKTLKEKLNLSLLYLNFSDRHKETGEVMGEHWFDTNLEKDISDGKSIFQHCIEQNFGAVVFITATVFRTELAQTALQKCPISLNNWGVWAYWAGFCASQGSVLVTKDNYIENTIGVSYWQKDAKDWFKILHWDIPEVYVKLQEIGYPRNFCKKIILNILKEDLIGKDALINVKYYLWCFKEAPLWSINVVSHFLFFIYIILFRNNSKEKLPLDIKSNKLQTIAEKQ